MHNAILDTLGKDGNKVQLQVKIKEIIFSMKKENKPHITSEISIWQHYLALFKGNGIFE